MTRDLLHDELERLWVARGLTVLFVTHNVREAVRLGRPGDPAVEPTGPGGRRVRGRRPTATPDRVGRGLALAGDDHRATARGGAPACTTTDTEPSSRSTPRRRARRARRAGDDRRGRRGPAAGACGRRRGRSSPPSSLGPVRLAVRGVDGLEARVHPPGAARRCSPRSATRSPTGRLLDAVRTTMWRALDGFALAVRHRGR